MAVENSGSLISDLDDNLPQSDDYISEGADHIRLIKHNLQYTLPNIDSVVTASSTKLNQMDSYMDFTTSGTNRKINLQNPTILGNGLNAVLGTDFTVLQQVKDLITAAFQNTVYRVGSYYISDDSTTPLQVLGFGSWTRVAGFIAGAGNVIASDGIATKNLIAGTSGGRHAYLLAEGNIPELSKDMSTSGVKAASAGSGHIHGFDGYGIVGDGGFSTGQGGNPGIGKITNSKTYAGEGLHEHSMEGTLKIGNASPTQIDNLPPYAVTNIWKRIA